MATKPTAIPASETHFAAAVVAFMASGLEALRTFALTVCHLAETEGLTVQQCTAAIHRNDWGTSTRTVKRLARMARAICEVKPSQRKARVAALLVCPRSYATIGSVDAICVEKGWGLASGLPGSTGTAGTGKGKAKAPNHKTDKTEPVAAVKMTASRVAEYITQMAQKPAAWAALNKALADSGLVLRVLEDAEETE